MNTRWLEDKRVVRTVVEKAELLDVTSTTVLLQTTATPALHNSMKSAGTDMFEQYKRGIHSEQIEGRVQIDLLSDQLLRVRYAEGTSIPENQTAMVVGTFTGPLQSDVAKFDDRLTLTTSAIQVTVYYSPYRLDVRDLAGRKLCGVGGPEKDHFHNWDSYNTGVCAGLDGETSIGVESFDLHYDEAVYGFGEHFIKLNKVGQTIDLTMTDGLGVITQRAYKNVPFFVSTNGYGVFFNHSCQMTAWVGSMAASDVQIAAEDPFLDYYIMTGSIKEVLSAYTDITGKGVLPPKWSFGYWQGKFTYHSAEETLAIARKYRDFQIPCDVIHVDTDWFKEDWHCDFEFDPVDFPDPKGYFAEMAQLGFKVSLWQMPYILEGFQIYKELEAVDGMVKNPDGSIYNLGFYGQHPDKISGVIDFSNPEATAIYQRYLRKVLEAGARVIKTDFGEAAPSDGVYFDGTPGRRMHNLYPLLYNQAAYDVTKEVWGDEAMVWARSAWAGNQRYPMHWGGDNSSNYFNMEPQLAGGLSFGLSGFQFWSHDIAGFADDAFADEARTVRWMQLGLFVSHSRIHGVGEREIYNLAQPGRDICAHYIKLRYQLMPYIYGSAMQCVQQSLPMTRPLVVEYQDDPNTYNLSSEYLFGDSLLVVPVFNEESRRRVYLPAGVWTDWHTRERVQGNCWIERDVPLEIIPLYIREGAIIPMGPVMNYVDERPTEKITLRVALFAGNGTSVFTVPVNDTWVPVQYVAEDGVHTVTIGCTDVAFEVESIGTGQVTVIRD